LSSHHFLPLHARRFVADAAQSSLLVDIIGTPSRRKVFLPGCMVTSIHAEPFPCRESLCCIAYWASRSCCLRRPTPPPTRSSSSLRAAPSRSSSATPPSSATFSTL